MTPVLVVVGIIVVVAFVVMQRRNERGPRRPEPKPGEGMDRHDIPPDGMVPIDVMASEEAVVARGLLEAAGIPVAVSGLRTALPAAYRSPPRAMRLYVDPERLDEARALLAGEGLDAPAE
jgi:hypothetical protein